MTPLTTANACAHSTLDFMGAYTRFLIAEIRRLDPSIRITPPQYRALILLERAPGTSLTEFARELGIRTPTASVIVVRLVRDGLVERTSAGGRRLSLALTTKGRRLIVSVRDQIIATLTEALKEWPEPQLAHSIQALQQIQHLLENLR